MVYDLIYASREQKRGHKVTNKHKYLERIYVIYVSVCVYTHIKIIKQGKENIIFSKGPEQLDIHI